MATNGKAAWHGSATHSARVGRNLSALLVGQPPGSHANAVSATTRAGAYGAASDTELVVTSTGGLGWSCSAGRCGGPGTSAAYQGWYGGYNDAAVTGTFAARHATLSRTELVCWRTRDTDEDATGFEDDGIVVISGTAGSGVPALPASLGTLVVLYEATVTSAAVNTPVTFVRRVPMLSAIGAPVACTSTTRPTNPRDRLLIQETDTDRVWQNDAGVWQPVKGAFGGLWVSTGAILPTSEVPITWATEAEDTDGYGAVGNPTITIPAALGGKYVVSAWVSCGTGFSASGAVKLMIGGSAGAVSCIPPGAGDATVSRSFRLNGGTTVGLRVYNGHSATISDFTFTLELVRVGD
jgi:hypothetical protein